MKKHKPLDSQMLAAAIAVGLKRFQIYRENSDGTRILVHVINSETEAVEAFMKQAPVFDGGDIHLYNQHEQRIIAFVKWKMMTTEIGLPVRHRINVFHDWHLALLARQNQNSDSSGHIVQPTNLNALIISKRLPSFDW